MDQDDKWEERLYDQFPRGADNGFGPEQGFNTWVHLNDPSLFTEEARSQPAVRAFLDAPFSVNFVQFKSSHRENEWFLHKPHRAMAEGGVDSIVGGVAGFPSASPRIATLVINHERTLAKFITWALVAEDGNQAGQMIYKQDDGSL